MCPNHAILDKNYPVGSIRIGKHSSVVVKSGIMNMGEESGIPIIRELLKDLPCNTNVIDCPPGSACTVMESIKDADFCIIVAEPTVFGVHNLKMVYELVKTLNKSFGIVINKVTDIDNPMEKLCEELDLPVLERIPFDRDIAVQNAICNIAYETNTMAKEIFDRLYTKISEAAK